MKKTTIEEEKEIANRIIDGYNNKKIIEEFRFSHKIIYRIAKAFNLCEKLKENNKKCKREVGERVRNRAFVRYEEFDKKHGRLIEIRINEGAHQNLILKEFHILQTFFERFIKWKSLDLVEQLRINGIRVNKENALKNSLLGAEKVRGVELKPFSEEAVKIFLKLKDEGKCLAEIKRCLSKLGYKDKKVVQLCQRYGKPDKRSFRGELNPSFGVTPSKKCGKGITGSYFKDGKQYLFRSSLELKIFLYLSEVGINFDLSKHRIPYQINGVNRTYQPDIVIDDTIYEIKPIKLVAESNNCVKFVAARNYCNKYNLKFDIITEQTYCLKTLNKEIINLLIENRVIELSEKQLVRIFNAIDKGWIK